MLQILQFNLDGQKLTKADGFPDIVEKSNKYLKMVVSGIPEGFSATAYFTLSWETTSVYNLVLNGGEGYIDEYLTTLPENPSEYFDYTLSVSIAAINGDGVRITSNPIIVKVDKSNFSNETSNTPELPESQFDEILSMIAPATFDSYGTVKAASEEHIDSRSDSSTVITPPNLEYAVKSVGDGYYAKLEDLPKDKVYEHIATVTVEADADGTLPSSVVISADSEGKPFELTDFYVVMTAGMTDGNGGGFYFGPNNDYVLGNVTGLGFRADTLRVATAHFENKGGGLITASVATSNAAPYEYSNQVGLARVVNIPPTSSAKLLPVKSVKMDILTGTAKTWIAGSTFKLYGVRK